MPADAAYFHAQFRRVNPCLQNPLLYCWMVFREEDSMWVHYLAWGVHNNGWWGEGEIKFLWMTMGIIRRFAERAQKIISAGHLTMIRVKQMLPAWMSPTTQNSNRSLIQA
ncbi:MAG: DUF2961 domain-containing protein [Puia sp.]